MTNRRYDSGRAFEYRAKAYLERRGFKVVRSAGSHGPIDLLAGRHEATIPFTFGTRLAVQCKHGRSKFSAKDAAELIEWASAFDAIPILISNDGRKLITSRVEKTGTRPIAV